MRKAPIVGKVGEGEEGEKSPSTRHNDSVIPTYCLFLLEFDCESLLIIAMAVSLSSTAPLHYRL